MQPESMHGDNSSAQSPPLERPRSKDIDLTEVRSILGSRPPKRSPKDRDGFEIPC